MADWRNVLPPVRGKLLHDQPLAPYTWFRVGGPADVLFLPADEDDLADFLKAARVSQKGHTLTHCQLAATTLTRDRLFAAHLLGEGLPGRSLDARTDKAQPLRDRQRPARWLDVRLAAAQGRRRLEEVRPR